MRRKFQNPLHISDKFERVDGEEQEGECGFLVSVQAGVPESLRNPIDHSQNVMKTITITGFAASALLALPATANTGARIECFAPGMKTPTILNTAGGAVSVDLGAPFRYEIWGVSGALTLGDKATGTKLDGQSRFTRLDNNSKVNSHSWVKLQVNSEQFYPQSLFVSGPKPAATTGNVSLSGDHWVTNQRHGISNVNLVFHLAGTTSGLNTPHPNRNPTGYFHVLGEYQATPPVPTGTISASPKLVQAGNTTDVTWSIFRAGTASTYACAACAPTGTQTIIGTPIVTGGSVDGGKNNNGHGNNLDGVDVSNPGQGRGGPNGAIDLSGSFDDEGKGFRRLSK